MKKLWYKFLRPTMSTYGMQQVRTSFEQIQYPLMEFSSAADANKYARLVLGHNCFANVLTDEEMIEKVEIEAKFVRPFV